MKTQKNIRKQWSGFKLILLWWMVDFLVKKARRKIHEDTKEYSQTMEWF